MHVPNDVQVSGEWDPEDDRDASTTITVDFEVSDEGNFLDDPDEEFDAEAIAIQKDIALVSNVGTSGYSPDDVVKYTLTFQVSDYFSFGNITVTDILPDGLEFMPDGYDQVYITIGDRTFNFTDQTFTEGEITTSSDEDDNTQIIFDVSSAIDRLADNDGYLQGGYTDGNEGTAATGTITYYAKILHEYVSEEGEGGDVLIDQGDVFNNTVSIEGDIYGYDSQGNLTRNIYDSNGDDTGEDYADDRDDSSAGFEIAVGSVTKDIYAINGSTTDLNDYHVEPGDTVTYRLTYTLPTSDFESFSLTDYLPLPVFDVDDYTWTFIAQESDTAPGTGEVWFHTDDTFWQYTIDKNDTQTPTLSTNSTDNSLIFTWDAFHLDNEAAETTIDVLFTVTVSDDPFADGLKLTNQVRAAENGTPADASVTDDIKQITLDQPELEITKGVVDVFDSSTDTYGTFTNADGSVSDVDSYFSDPTGTTETSLFTANGEKLTSDWLSTHSLDTDLSGVDAGDTILYAIVIENTGHFEAYDITLTDDLFSTDNYSSISGLTITDGTGAAIAYTGDLFSESGISITGYDKDGDGYADDGDGLVGIDDAEGKNIILVTYEMTLDSDIEPLDDTTNTATITNYANSDEGQNYVPDGLTDEALVINDAPTVTKTLVSTSITNSTNTTEKAVIGEIATYEIKITIPEGTTDNAVVYDTLDAGLTFIGWAGSTVASVKETDISLSYTEVSNTGEGQNLIFELGNLTNENSDNTTSETIILQYQAYVNNTTGNQNDAPTTLDNKAYLSFSGGQSNTADADDITVIEPELEVLKSVLVDSDNDNAFDDGDNTGDGNDKVQYTITIQHTAIQHTDSGSETDAYDVSFTDEIPAEIETSSLVIKSVSSDLGLNASDFVLSGNTLSLSSSLQGSLDIPLGSAPIVITITGTLIDTVSPNQIITNQAVVTWSSLDNDTDDGLDANERTGDDFDPDDPTANVLNDYGAVGSADIEITRVEVDKSIISTSLDDNGNENATIGETVRYQVQLTIPEGVLTDAVLEDTLPDGLEFIELDGIILSSGITSNLDKGSDASLGPEDIPVDESPQTITFALGTLTNASVAGADPQTVTLRYLARVLDDADNNYVDQESINGAKLTWGPEDNRAESDTGTTTLNIVEPQIETEKLISLDGTDDSYGTEVSGVEAGDTLYYEITLKNNNPSENGLQGTTAFDVTAEDLLPEGVSYKENTAEIVAYSGLTDAQGDPITEDAEYLDIYAVQFTDGSDEKIQFLDTESGDGWDITTDGYITIRYQVTVDEDIVIDGDYTNVVDADWSTLDGNPVDDSGNPIERDYDDQVDGDGDPLYAVDGDQDEADAVFTIPEATISKDDGDVTTATIGDIITYTLRINSPEGTLNNMQVQDILSAGLIYNGDAKISIDGGTNFTELPPAQSASNDGSANVTLTWNMDNYKVDTDEIILIQYTATVANVATNQDGDPEGNTLNNQVTLTYTDVNGDTVTDGTLPDGSQTDNGDNNTDGFTVVEPQITTTKAVSDPPIPEAGIQPNDILTYTITLENTGSADAYEVTAEDILPDGVILFTDTSDSDYVAPSVSGIADGISITDNGDGTLFITNSTGEGWDIAQGDSIVIKYQVQVKGAAYVVGAHTNYVDADWTGQDGDPTTSGGIEREYDDGETQQQWTSEDGTQDEATVDFITKVNPPVVGDFVWFDVNGDGVQDPGEPGISGVEINLYGNNPDNFGDEILLATAVTDSNGWYEFTHLPLTTNSEVLPYRVQVNSDSLPDEMEQTAEKKDFLDNDLFLDNQTYFDVLDITENILDIDFGYTGSGTIGDTIWYDSNQDGIEDATENGIAGAEVTLRGDLNGDGIFDYTATTTTDSNGEYSFTNLPFVDYEVIVTSLPGGLSVQTGDPDSTLDSRHEVTLSDASPDIDTVDFGYVATGSIGDTVWANTDGDSTFDADESGLANVEVILTGDVNFDGIIDTLTTTTDGNGNYIFNNLPVGDYTITVNTSTLPDGLTAAGANYDLDGGNDSTTTVTLGADENLTDVDFGFGDSDYGSIGDTVWLDLDGDGTQNAGNEIGLSEVTVNLLDESGTIIDTAVTDADGQYFFGDLEWGEYTVQVDNTSLPDGLTQTYDLTGAQDDHSATVTIDANQRNWDTVDFGYQGDGSIGDTVWLDLDGNNVPDVGGDDFGLANVDVTLAIDIDGDGDYDTTMTTTTDENGSYEFTGLPYTDYKVIIDTDDLPEGVTLSYYPDGGTENESELTLDETNPTNDSQDFGYQGTGSIGDTVWNNINGDNSSDGETGINDVEVTLTGDFNNDGVVSDNESITVTTGNNGTDDGQYLFENLPEGDYTVTVDTSSDALTDLDPNYDADGGNDATTEVTLAAGESNTDVDFGFGDSDKGSIGDTIWLDVDGDGVQDPTEVGIAGVTVYLYDGTDTSETGTFVTTTTDSDGHYYFGDLDINTYTVVVDRTTLPNGVFQTYDPDGARDHSNEITLTSDTQNVDTVDFGYRGQGRVGDTVWLDLDNNGEPNVGAGDFGLAGVDITLTVDFDGNNTPDATFTTTTDAYGQYLFEGLPYGAYTVTLDESDLPGNVSLVSDPENDSDNTSSFTLDDTTTSNLDQDFGYRGTGSIGDTVWFDEDADGNVTPGEGPLGDDPVTLILTGDFNNDGVVGPDEQVRVETDPSDGTYIFEGLANGDYTVRVDPTTIPDGYEQSGDRDDTLDNRTAVTLSTDNNVITDADFGYTTVSSIGDTIWFDYDGDGIQDADEPGLAGVTVTLTDEDGNTFIDSTDENGNYLFNELSDGTYTVTVDTSTLPTTGLEPTADLDGIATPNSATLSLENGQSNMDVDFGYTGTGSVGDTLWNDENQNGVQDGGEAGLPGVEITVGIDLDGDNSPDYTVTTTTDSNGNYLIDNLPAGSHIVTVAPETLPEGITPSFDPDGTLDNSFTVTLSPGQNVDSVDFGYVYPPKPSPAPSAPVAPLPVTPSEPDTTLAVDAYLLNYLFGGERGDIFDYFQREWEETYQPQILPVAPIYSGRAEPGTTLALTLIDAEGNELTSQSVMADTAGNWIANFSGALLYDVPHQMVIKQSISSYNHSTQGLFNMRTHFNPTFASLVFSDTKLDVNAIMASLPSTIIRAIHEGNNQTLNPHWDDFAGYEFFTSSTNPSQHSH